MAFCIACISQSMGSKMCSTFVKERTCKPVWEEEFTLTVEEEESELELVVCVCVCVCVFVFVCV